MTVDLEAIARRGRCDVSSLQIALPLFEQGYSPPFLARYRRDELGGVDEASLWLLEAAIREEKETAERRDELTNLWQQTPLADPAIGQAIRKASSKRILERIARRLKLESSDRIDPSMRLAVRVLNPRKGDVGDLDSLAVGVDGVDDAAKAVAGLDEALPKRLAGDPRVISAAVRWLAKHAKIHVASINDPHLADGPEEPADQQPAAHETAAASDVEESAAPDAVKPGEETAVSADVPDNASTSSAAASDSGETTSAEIMPSSSAASTSEPTEADAVVADATVSEPPDPSAAAEPPDTSAAAEPPGAETPGAESAAAPSDVADTLKQSPDQKGGKRSSASKAGKAARKAAKKPKKKISPRQRRRRWLVSVLQPLAGKRIAANKLSSFQIVMLGRALRSQVAQCAFEYDATKLVAELQRTVGGFNRYLSEELSAIVLEHEANIREAAESAWWDELHERASSRLVGIAADHLRRHVNRGNVDAKVVMSIDAVGPRTAATAIVASDGRLLHSEDLPCQLSQALRSQAVARMGELIHTHHVDLIVISNGPSRRACMVAVGDLIAQSPEKSIRWTLADRSGADVYAGSSVADQELRGTPRRFRAAAWLAFSVLQPAPAFTKVDPLKLRLASFQRELTDEALSSTLESIMVSGASRGGVDANSASIAWLARLPGVSEAMAESIDASRRESLFKSREAISELEQWQSVVESRQAIPFLRVFQSDEVLDGTLIHPEDYPLAKKLASVLQIELPPASPPGYQPPEYMKQQPQAEPAESSDEITAAAASGDAAEAAVDSTTDADLATDGGLDSGETEQHEAGSNASEGFGEPAAETASLALQPESSETETAESADTDQDNDSSSANLPESHPAAVKTSASEPESQATAMAPAAEPIRRPKPEQSKIDKCIKEWQVGSRRVNQLVHWLCDPFGDSDASGRPPAVLTSMPSIKGLKQGDQVIGVVVGVMPFGVFVELAPDCSGLIHVSRVSDAFVEDVHEALQVGDVVTAWVTGIDDKRRRVALSAVSPEREAELREIKQERDAGGGRGTFRGGQDLGGGQAGRGDSRGQERGQARGGQARVGQARVGQARGSEQRPGDARGKSAGPPRGGQRRDSRGDSRGGRSRDTRGGGGRGREKKPESYRVVSSEPAAPISDAMKKGVEPLRSFGDLLQFYGKKDEPATKGSAGESSSDAVAESAATEVAGENTTQDVAAELAPQPMDAGQASADDSGSEDKPSDQSAPTDASSS